jgi:hypothetical protein
METKKDYWVHFAQCKKTGDMYCLETQGNRPIIGQPAMFIHVDAKRGIMTWPFLELPQEVFKK